MRPIYRSVLVWICLLIPVMLLPQVRCDTLLQISGDRSAVTLTGIWKDQSAAFSEVVEVLSPGGGQFEVMTGDLKEKTTRRIISADKITLSNTSLTLTAGEPGQIAITVKDLAEPGEFEGMLYLRQKGGNCRWELPLYLLLYGETQVEVQEEDRTLTVKAVSPSWFNGILPPALRQQRINVRLENLDALPVVLDSFSLSLKGKSSGAAFTEQDMVWVEPQRTLRPKGEMTLQLKLRPQRSLPADEYQGNLRLYFRNQEAPVSVSVNLHNRSGAGWALLALLIGVFCGRIIKDVNASKDQIPLMKKCLSLRAQAGRLEDKSSRQRLEAELDDLEARINQVSSEAERKAIEPAFEPLETKIKKLSELEALIEQAKQNLPEEEDYQANADKLNIAFYKIRDSILDGKPDITQQGMDALTLLLQDLQGKQKRAVSSPGQSAAKVAMDRSIALILQKDDAAKQAKEGSPLERGIVRILNWLSGIRVTARLRFALFRPLVALLTFAVILLLGFQEVYIKGGDTFGAEGLYDYLKLFLWGVVSDVFSRTLIGDKAVNILLGKEESNK